jgi:hypothetical protein
MPLALQKRSGQCFVNAYINKRHCYKDLNLKLVIGSIAYNGWFEYGGEHWRKEDFLAKYSGWAWDAHAWLEDEDGNIYDYIFEWDNTVSKLHTGKPIKHLGLIEKASKYQCSRWGLTYVPADKETQTMIFLKMLKHCKDSESIIATTGICSVV